MSIKLMSLAWDDAEVKGSDLLVLLCLADHANDEGLCWPSVERIAQRSRISERQVQYSIKALIEAGWLVREKMGGLGKATLYRVLANKVHPTVQNVHPDGERTFTPTIIEPSYNIPASQAVSSDDSPDNPEFSEPEFSKEEARSTLFETASFPLAEPSPPRAARPPSPKITREEKVALCRIIHGHENLRLLSEGDHANIARLWSKLSREGIGLDAIGEWEASEWRKTWPGNTGQRPRPNQVLNGVAAFVAHQPDQRQETAEYILEVIEEEDGGG